MTTMSLCLLGGTLGLCGFNGTEARREQEPKRGLAVAEVQDVTVEVRSAGTWAVRVVRRDGDRTKEAVVIVRSEQEPSPPDVVYVRLAGARAWLALVEDHLAAKRWIAALSPARKGIEELGRTYARPEAFDDTSLYEKVAERQREQGELEEAARTLAGILQDRISSYLDLHKDSVVGLLPPLQR
jgi:hypothetical protein